MAKKLRKRVFKGKPNEVVEQINESIRSEVAEDNSASISINIQLVFEETNLTPDRLLEISGDMQSFLDDTVKDFDNKLNLKSYRDANSFKKGQVEAVGRANGKVFRAVITRRNQNEYGAV